MTLWTKEHKEDSKADGSRMWLIPPSSLDDEPFTFKTTRFWHFWKLNCTPQTSFSTTYDIRWLSFQKLVADAPACMTASWTEAADGRALLIEGRKFSLRGMPSCASSGVRMGACAPKGKNNITHGRALVLRRAWKAAWIYTHKDDTMNDSKLIGNRPSCETMNDSKLMWNRWQHHQDGSL